MKTFSCPQCGGSLDASPVTGLTIQCPYCRSTVIVPPELRPPAPLTPDPEPPKPNYLIPAAIIFVVILFAVMLVFKGLNKPPTGARPTYTPPRATFPPVSVKTTPTPATDVLLTFGGEGTGNGLFKQAQEIAVDGSGNIYVTDDTTRVQKFDAEGKFVSVWTLPSETKWYTKFRGGPDKILTDRAGNILVLASGVVLKLDAASGDILGAAHGTDYIHDAATTADGGLLLVSEKEGDDELVRLDAQGRPVRRVHRFMSKILDKRLAVRALRVASDGVGNIFAVYALGNVNGMFSYDEEDITIQRLTPEGKYVNKFGSAGHEAGQYSMPGCINVDNQSRVYICDDNNGLHLYAADGRYLENIKTPFWVQALALDKDNNIYVVGSNKVAKLKARP